MLTPHAFPSLFRLRLATPAPSRAVNVTNTHLAIVAWPCALKYLKPLENRRL
jgi:hypothetical protein